MSSLLENTSRIANAKENIKTSLIDKGAEFLEDEKIDTYSSKIDNLDVIIPGTYNVECYIRVDGELISSGNTYSLLSEDTTGEDVSSGSSDGSEDSGSSGSESDGSEDIVDSGSDEDTGSEEFVGMDFIITASDGSTQTATSREGGFIYLTLNYGVAYDVQPAEQNKYYATEHSLIYHRKEDGDYFAADYYFYTAGSSGGNYQSKTITENGTYTPDEGYDAFSDVIVNVSSSKIDKIKIRSLEHFLNERIYLNDYQTYLDFMSFLDFTELDITSGRYAFNGWYNNTTNYKTNINVYKDFLERDFMIKIKSFYYGAYNHYLCDFDSDVQININLSNCTSLNDAFFNLCTPSTNEEKYKIIFDFNGTTGYVSDFTYTFACVNSGVNHTRMDILNLNMDKATSTNSTFGTSSYKSKNKKTRITFNGSFGGLSTTSSLTIDLSVINEDYYTIDSFLETIQSLSNNTNGNTRIIKLSSSIYDNLTDEIFDLADEKGYTLSS